MMTLGEYRVGISFNPSNSNTVDKIKRAAADLIDAIHSISIDIDSTDHIQRGEIARLQALAMTDVEKAAMWAVKAATKGPRE